MGCLCTWGNLEEDMQVVTRDSICWRVEVPWDVHNPELKIPTAQKIECIAASASTYGPCLIGL